jgi:O-antigen ligase
VAVGALSPPFAPDPPLAWREWRLCMLEPALLYYLLRLGRENELRGHKERTTVLASPLSPWLRAWALSGVVVALVGLGQWVVRALVPAGGVGRITGVYYSPNHLALYLERIWPLFVALVLCSDLERRWRLRAWFATALSGAALYLTYSRGAWLLALPAALGVVGWAYRRRLRWWMALGGAIALFLVVANVFYGRAAAPSGMLGEVRISVWRSTLAMVADHPWRGVGLDGFRYVYPRYMLPEAWTEPVLYHPHNAWLDAAARLGLPGLAAFTALVACCLYGARRAVRDASGPHKAVAVGLLAGLLAALAHGMVDSGNFLVDLAWSLALVAGTLNSPERRALR